MTIINLRDFYYWYTQDEYMQALAVRALQKIDALTEAEFAGLALFAAEDE